MLCGALGGPQDKCAYIGVCAVHKNQQLMAIIRVALAVASATALVGVLPSLLALTNPTLRSIVWPVFPSDAVAVLYPGMLVLWAVGIGLVPHRVRIAAITVGIMAMIICAVKLGLLTHTTIQDVPIPKGISIFLDLIGGACIGAGIIISAYGYLRFIAAPKKLRVERNDKEVKKGQN
jgi:hypothetical protein